MTTAQATLFLQEYLEPHLGPEDPIKYSSHSCKPTLLTWAGMSDMFSREERTLMGHHLEASTKSATVYNRDALLLVHSKIARLVVKHRVRYCRLGDATPWLWVSLWIFPSKTERPAVVFGGLGWFPVQASLDLEWHP